MYSVLLHWNTMLFNWLTPVTWPVYVKLHAVYFLLFDIPIIFLRLPTPVIQIFVTYLVRVADRAAVEAVVGEGVAVEVAAVGQAVLAVADAAHNGQATAHFSLFLSNIESIVEGYPIFNFWISHSIVSVKSITRKEFWSSQVFENELRFRNNDVRCFLLSWLHSAFMSWK